jgi:hypothetical protein
VNAARARFEQVSSATAPRPGQKPSRAADDHTVGVLIKISLFWLAIAVRFVYAVIRREGTLAAAIPMGAVIVLILGGCALGFVRITRRRG